MLPMTSNQVGRAPRATMTPSIDRLMLACVHATRERFSARARSPLGARDNFIDSHVVHENRDFLPFEHTKSVVGGANDPLVSLL
jgi:hypothetical protein